MKTYFGIKREVYKGNGLKVDETIVYPVIYKTEEEAVKAALNDQDNDSLRYDYQIANPLTSLQYVRNSKTNRETIYRHEWVVIKYHLNEEEEL